MADPVKIDIQTTASGNGAAKTAEGLKDVQAAAGKAGAATKDTAKDFNALGEQAEKAAGAGRVVGEVLRGNIGALAQIGPLLKAAGAAFAANPIFFIGSIIAAVALPALAKFKAGWKSVEDQAVEAGKASADAGGAALDAISKKQTNETAANFRDIATAAGEARAQIDAVTAALTAQVDADEAVEIAAINANPALGTLARAEQTAQARRAGRDRRAQIQTGALDAQEAVTASATESTRAVVARKRQQEEAAARLVGSVAARSPAVIQRELDAVQPRRDAITNGGVIDKAEQTELAQLGQQESDLRAELADATANYAQRLKQAQDRLASATEARADAAEALAEAEAKQAAERSVNQAKRAVIEVGTASANAVSDISVGAARTASRKAAEREAALELIGADGANTATKFAQQLASSPAAKSDPAVKAAAAALAAAAQAAREGGTTEGEVQALIGAMEAIREVFVDNKRTSAILMREIATLKQQFANSRN